MEDLTVDIEKTINAPIERVFDAWLDPELLSRFMLPMPGMKHPRVTCDPRQGGDFEIVMYVGDNEVPHTGRYLEVERPHKLAFSWVSPASRDDSVVTLTFSETGEQGTHVHLRHVKFYDEGRRADHEGGWTHILETLAAAMSPAASDAA